MGKWGTFTVILVLVVLGIATVELVKKLGETAEQRGEIMVEAHRSGGETACVLQMRAIYQSLRVAAAGNDDKLPESLTELYAPGDLRCRVNKDVAYEYVPGQDFSMPASNIVVYEAHPAHNGRCVVLRLGGGVELLSPDRLRAELSRTRRVIAARQGRSR